MKFRWDKKYLYWGLTAFLVIVLSISFFILLNNFQVFMGGVAVITAILMPFILAIVFAYLLNPIMDFMEEKWILPLFGKRKSKKPTKAPRVISVTVTVILALTVITGLIVMVMPQLIDSIMRIVNNLPSYLGNLQDWALKLVKSNVGLQQIMEEQFENVSNFVTEWAKNNFMPQINGLLSGITSGVFGVVNVLKNVFIGIILSVYILFSKEKFFAQSKKLLYSICSLRVANVILKNTRKSHKVFGGFIVGKLIDSAIIGLLCFLGMTVFKMPFALLVSVIIGVSNIIPFFGPFIGAIPSALLIFMIDPMSALYFVIFIILLQQFDGNILGPKILGDSTGLTAFWVMFAILVGGGLFGFVGMVMGVPTFAVIYSIIVEMCETRLRKNELPVNTQDYDGLDYIKDEPLC